MKKGSGTGLRARWLRTADGRFETGALVIVGSRIERVALGRGAIARARAACRTWVDLGDVTLAPGYVNAHTHLELSLLHGRVARGTTFVDWIAALLVERARCVDADLESAARAAADELVTGGTTLAGDIAASAIARTALRGHPLRVCELRELLDAGDPARTRAAVARARRRRTRAPRRYAGLSPHSPYTVSPALARALGRLAAQRREPIAVHWAETAAEREWLECGAGPFGRLVARSPLQNGLELLAGSGLLGPRTLLVHANDATAAEIARVARAGASVVHCPGAHRFFSRPPFPARAWMEAGVPLALGTDSLASNARLDLRREMALFAAAEPLIDPRTILDLATVGGARALGFAARTGVLIPGAWADVAAHATRANRASALAEELVRAEPVVVSTWIGGRPARARGLC